MVAIELCFLRYNMVERHAWFHSCEASIDKFNSDQGEDMKKEISSRFLQQPATKIGRWSGGLALLSMVMLALNNFGLNPFNQMSGKLQPILVTAWDMIMLGSLLAGIVLGIIAVTRKRERSWIAWLFMIPLVFLLLLLAAFLHEVITSRQPMRAQTAPTPDARIVRTPVFFDDDGSPDGTSALLFLLSDPRAEVNAVSMSYGEAHPQIYIQHLGALLERAGYGDIPLGAGQDAPLAGNNAFPNKVREGSNDFWGFPSGSANNSYPVEDSAALLVKICEEADKPLTLLVTGSLTNLAQALRLEPGIKNKIAAVYIMGGAVYTDGNIKGLIPESQNNSAEWNIFADPLAASEVFASGLPLYLVPLDATNQVNLNKQNTRAWRKGGSIPDFAADIYDSRMESWNRDEIEFWDLMTAEIMLNPAHCVFTPLHLEVVTEEGNTQGQTRAVDGTANVNVCLEPDVEAIKQELSRVFNSRK